MTNEKEETPYVLLEEEGAAPSQSYSSKRLPAWASHVKVDFNNISKNQIILFALCAILFILGFLSLFAGWDDFILGILTIILAAFGFVGGLIRTQQLMFIFLIGVAVLLIFSIIVFIINIFFISIFGMILSLIMTLFYGACAFFGFLVYQTSSTI